MSDTITLHMQSGGIDMPIPAAYAKYSVLLADSADAFDDAARMTIPDAVTPKAAQAFAEFCALCEQTGPLQKIDTPLLEFKIPAPECFVQFIQKQETRVLVKELVPAAKFFMAMEFLSLIDAQIELLIKKPRGGDLINFFLDMGVPITDEIRQCVAEENLWVADE